MSKRSSVSSNNIQQKDRIKNDWYPTPRKAVESLIPYLPEYANFYEPCAGDGALVKHIEDLTEGAVACTGASDIDPKAALVVLENDFELPIATKDVLDVDHYDVLGKQLIITNPPFSWPILKGILEHLPALKPTWLLLPFGYACNKRMSDYMKYCKKVVPIGRVKWIEDSKQSSTEDFAWFLFDKDYTGTTKLYPRK